MKKRVLITGIYVIGMVAALASAVCADWSDRIVAVVNEDVITRSELDARLYTISRGVSATDTGQFFKLRTQALDLLIDEKLTVQEVDRLGLRISEDEVDAALERVKQINYLTDETLRQELAAQGLSLAAYREQLRNQLQKPRLINREVKSKVIVTREDIKRYYETHPEHYGGSTEYRIGMFLVRSPVTADRMNEAGVPKELAQVHQALAQGESFASLSPDETLVLKKDLGFISESSLSAPLRAALKGLDTGGFTPVVSTDLGYQILVVLDTRDLPGKDLDAVSESISDILYQEMVNTAFVSWLEQLRAKSHIQIYQ
ncbi:MAG: hypothetical protein CSA22_00120 [Deltaproteobacteria bacterium]|nr:MAG: hypothetical protein CSA22_00120 [Deltaproteobacteria bacterium]